MLSRTARKRLVELADSLDSKGFRKEADQIDSLMDEESEGQVAKLSPDERKMLYKHWLIDVVKGFLEESGSYTKEQEMNANIIGSKAFMQQVIDWLGSK